MPDKPEEEWDAVQESERQIEAGRAARRRRRAATRSETVSLLEDLQTQRLVTTAELRELAARGYSQPVVSLYLELTPDKVVRRPPVAVSVFNSMRHSELAARQDLIDGLSAAQRSRLKDDLDEIEMIIPVANLASARSLVILKSARELNRVISLPVRAADSLTIDLDPYLEPLEAALEQHPAALVVKVSKKDSHFWVQHLGHLEELESLEAFVPSESVDASRPGKVQRHRLTHLRWHLKATAHLASRLFAERGFRLLVLAGDDSVLPELERYLPDWLRSRIAGRLHPSPHQDRHQWQQQIERVLAQHRRAEEEAALARLGDYAARGVLASGLAGVLEVANRFLATRLFIRAELKQPGFVCPEHHFLALQAGQCPFCGSELLSAESLADELIEFARMHGVEVMLIEERPDLLDPHAGVAAVTHELSTV